MKTVILAGGFGTRISEETHLRPKPMIELGGMPILWHIMKIYSAHGLTDFIICCGYKGYMVKEYFANYFLHMSDVTFDFTDNKMTVHEKKAEPWKVTLVDTGDDTQTGGRIKRVKKYLDDDIFCLTYGDGVSNVNIRELIEFHRKQKTLATVTAIQPMGRFGELDVINDKIIRFEEKPQFNESWINAGYFVLSPKILDYIKDDSTIWEREPIEQLAKEGQLSAFKHSGFWKPMDTLRDKIALEELWQSENPPWKIW
ncbi:MAG: glucose-1-phosphate cytidylyltransferase [candidate division Zixibacteria bacterium 4484_95]|nr:MAG: glucose-1-phosphate cytidylyltransferase [candidate division Zixibacteria bacterium 4484_95]